MAWQMQVTETLSEGLKRAYTVVVPATDIETRRSERLVSLGKTLRLPGFRPGKVPMPIVRQRYGSAVSAEVLEESVSEATRQVLSERNLRPAMQPKIDMISQDPAGTDAVNDLEFKVELELLPDITLPDFGAISLTRMKAEVAPDAIETALGNIATAHRELVPITEQELAARTESPGAAAGEILTVDFVGKMDGTEFPGGKGEDIEVEMGGTGFIPGFAEQLTGMRLGETRTIEVTFPQDYGSADLAGKPASFDVTAKQLSNAVRPPLDDALAERIGLG
jgi:trigger factor